MVFLVSHVFLQNVYSYLDLVSIYLNMSWCLTTYPSYVALHARTVGWGCGQLFGSLGLVLGFVWGCVPLFGSLDLLLGRWLQMCSVLWLSWSSLGLLGGAVFRSLTSLVLSCDLCVDVFVRWLNPRHASVPVSRAGAGVPVSHTEHINDTKNLVPATLDSVDYHWCATFATVPQL